MYEQDDTIFSNKANTEFYQQSDEPRNRGKKHLSRESLKMAASALAGVGVGVGAMWAGSSMALADVHANTNNPQPSVAANNPQPAEDAATEPDYATATETSPQETPKAAPKSPDSTSGSKSETHRADAHNHQSTATPEHEPEQTPQPAINHGRIEIGEVQEVTDDEGNTIRLAQGTMDGHNAVFRVDDHNRVIAAIVDSNDNGEFESNEIVDLRGESIQVGGATPVANDEVQVISVENDVDLNGHAVNIAHIAVGDDEALLVDANQNGEADFLVHDDNGNNQIDDGEVHDISDSHMPMPQLDDVSGADGHLVQNDGLPDYSNDADITMYEA